MKGSLAACIGAAKMLADAGAPLRGDLVVAAVADEEYGSLGTADLVARCRPDAAIVTEPTNLQICLAHKGYIWIEVETTRQGGARQPVHRRRGRGDADGTVPRGTRPAGAGAARRARAPAGRSAVAARGDDPGRHGPQHLRRAAAACRSSGGRCRARRWMRRCRPDPGDRRRLAAEDPSFSATVRPFFSREPFEVSPDARHRPHDLAVRLPPFSAARPRSSATRPGWTRRCWRRPASRRW